MKLLKTVTKIIQESKSAYEEAADKGVNEKELDRLEKNYKDSLKLIKLYNLSIKKSDELSN